MTCFLKIAALKDTISTIKSNIEQIDNLHKDALNVISETESNGKIKNRIYFFQ